MALGKPSYYEKLHFLIKPSITNIEVDKKALLEPLSLKYLGVKDKPSRTTTSSLFKILRTLFGGH